MVTLIDVIGERGRKEEERASMDKKNLIVTNIYETLGLTKLCKVFELPLFTLKLWGKGNDGICVFLSI